MNIPEKIRQCRNILRESKSPLPLILDMMRLKRSDYIAECGGLLFDIKAHSHEWYTLYENIIRKDYFRNGVSVAPADVVIDVGANFGSFTVLAAKMVGDSGHVISFEPDPLVYDRLVRNVALNKLSNVTCRNEAVSGSDGTVELYVQSKSALSSNFKPAGERPLKSESKIEVTAVALKKVISSIECVSLLKVDCEGAEYDILGSLQKSDVANVMQISMETHKIEGREEREIVPMLADLGFKVFGEPALITALQRVGRLAA